MIDSQNHPLVVDGITVTRNEFGIDKVFGAEQGKGAPAVAFKLSNLVRGEVHTQLIGAKGEVFNVTVLNKVGDVRSTPEAIITDAAGKQLFKGEVWEAWSAEDSTAKADGATVLNKADDIVFGGGYTITGLNAEKY